jgi:putative inorganic carbon (HCO3(-)) transporter
MYGYADVPKIAAVRVLAGLMGIAGLAYAAARLTRSGESVSWSRLLTAGRERWIVCAAAAYLLTSAVSTIASVSWRTSLLGAYPGFDATDLYSLASYCVIGATAATVLRTKERLQQAFWAISIAGGVAALYGLFQVAGMDPLRFDRFEVNNGRVPLTFGNPSFAGSFLTISIFTSAGLLFLQRKVLCPAGITAYAMLALQVIALLATASRGAWVGTGAGAFVFAGLLYLGSRGCVTPVPWQQVKVLATGLAVATVAGILLVVTGTAPEGVSDRVRSFSGDLTGSGLNGREATWRASIDLVTRRPWIEGRASYAPLRHLFGYGPDTYRYAYQQVAPDEHVDHFVPYAHNAVLNVAVEQGIGGVVAWAALGLAVIVTGIAIVKSQTAAAPVRLLAAAAVAAYAAHAVDQLASVPRASDTLAMWVLAGVVVALAVIERRQNAGQALTATGTTGNRRTIGPLAATAPVVAIVGVAAVLGITVLGNAGHLLADRQAATLQSQMLQGARVSELSDVAGRASGLAGDVAYYHSLEAQSLETAAMAVPGNPSLQQQLLRRSLDARSAAVNAAPLSPAENLAYAAALLNAGRTAEAIASFETTVKLSPRYWAAWLELANAYAAAGRTLDGRAALTKAEELIARQADVTRFDEVTVSRFAFTRLALGIEPSY